MLNQLYQFNADRLSLEEMIELEELGNGVKKGFERRMLEVPSRLEDALRSISLEIATKARNELMLKYRDAKARQATLLSRDEKRARADAEVSKLEKQLGLESKEETPVATATTAG